MEPTPQARSSGPSQIPAGRAAPPDAGFGPPLSDNAGSGGLGAGLAVVFGVVIVVLLLLMATGYNDRVPLLHPAGGSNDTIVGDRDAVNYLFVGNGTFLNTTQSGLCERCPFTVATATQFSYNLTLTNGFDATIEVTHLTARPPFELVRLSPALSFPIAAGLSETFELELVSPSESGILAVPLTASASVA